MLKKIITYLNTIINYFLLINLLNTTICWDIFGIIKYSIKCFVLKPIIWYMYFNILTYFTLIKFYSLLNHIYIILSKIESMLWCMIDRPGIDVQRIKNFSYVKNKKAFHRNLHRAIFPVKIEIMKFYLFFLKTRKIKVCKEFIF